MFATPQDGNEARRGDLAVYLGGPLANLAAGLLALALSELVLTDNVLAVVSARGFAVFSFGVGLFNLYPQISKSGADNDGKSLLKILARRRRGERPDPADVIIQRASADISDRRPVAAADLEYLRRLSASSEVHSDYQISGFKAVAFASGDLQWLRRLIFQSERSGQPVLDHELSGLALAAAILDADEDTGRSFLDRVTASGRDDSHFLRALAAVEYVGGRREAALEAIARIRKIEGRADWGDDDDQALFHAIENGLPLPKFAQAV